MDNNRPIQPSDTKNEEFIRLFGMNQGRVFGYIVTLIPRWADAEDVLQRTSIVLWQKFDQFDPSCDFVRWACGIAHRQSLDYLRQQKRHRQVLNEVVLEKVAQTRLVRSDMLEQRHFNIDDCVEKLPTSDRDVIEHYYYQGKKTAAEVAAELGRPTNTILKALIRIRRLLHRCVNDAAASEDQK